MRETLTGNECQTRLPLGLNAAVKRNLRGHTRATHFAPDDGDFFRWRLRGEARCLDVPQELRRPCPLLILRLHLREGRSRGISNWRRIGIPEYMLLQDMINCVNWIVTEEDKLGEGK